MANVEKSVLVGYSSAQMYALVDQVEHYPEFLPWCGGAILEHRDGNTTRATIRIDYHGIRQSFRTENRTQPPDLIEIRLLSGPFRHLDGTWRFNALSDSACRVDFRLRYELANRPLERLVGPVFHVIANNLVDAFMRRAEKVYGE